MKTIWLAAWMVLSLFGHAWAGGAVEIELIANAAGDVAYTLRKEENAEKESKTPDDIELWLGTVRDTDRANLVILYADNRTPYRLVSDLLFRLKAVGVKQWAVVARDGTSLTGKATAILQRKPTKR